MRKFLMALPVLAMIPAGIGTALADERRAPPADWLSLSEIASKLTESGHKVTKLEIDDGRYEAKAIETGGAYVKLKIDPRTGAIISRKIED